MAFETDLIVKSNHFVEEFLRDKLTDDMLYHDLQHTKEVSDAAEEIGRAENLSDDELETVIISALFHDTGYYQGSEQHEVISKDIASDFLRDIGVKERKITDISGCIIATKLPQRPTNKMEEVLCDADLYHVANQNFFEKSELLRKELVATGETDLKDKKWRKKSLKFLKKHRFFTAYARENLLPVKKENLSKLKTFLQEQELSLLADGDSTASLNAKSEKEDNKEKDN
ncbi:HD domain-containing protein [Bacteroidota bacterium]